MLDSFQTWMLLGSLALLCVAFWAADTGRFESLADRIERTLGGTGTRPGWSATFEHLVTPPKGQKQCSTCGYFAPIDDLDGGWCPDCRLVRDTIRSVDAAVDAAHGNDLSGFARLGLRVEALGDHLVLFSEDDTSAVCSCGWYVTDRTVDACLAAVDDHFEDPGSPSRDEWLDLRRAIDDEGAEGNGDAP